MQPALSRWESTVTVQATSQPGGEVGTFAEFSSLVAAFAAVVDRRLLLSIGPFSGTRLHHVCFEGHQEHDHTTAILYKFDTV